MGESMMVRVELRAAEKNLGPSGTTLPSSPKFLVLHDHSDSHFLEVASDSGIVFDSSAGNPTTVLSIIRANEVAQASLAKAREIAMSSSLSQNAPVPNPSSSSDPPQPLGAVNAGFSSLVSSGHPGSIARMRKKKTNCLLARSRSSLRIKNLSFK